MAKIYPFILSIIFTSLFTQDNFVSRLLANDTINKGFDLQNLVTWAYAMSLGQVPIRDFWYPYFGRFIFDGANICCFWIEVIFNGINCFIVTWYFKKFFQYKLLFLVSLGLLFISLYLQFGSSGVARYFVALSFFSILSISGIQTVSSLAKLSLIFFGAFLFFIDPILCADGFIVFFIKKVFEYRNKIYKKAFLSILPALCCCLLFIAWFFFYDKEFLKSFFSQILNISDFAIPVTLQCNPVQWIKNFPWTSAELLMISIMALPIVFFNTRKLVCGSSNKDDHEIPLVFFLFSVILIQKQLIRPHMASQILFYPLCGILWTLGRRIESKLTKINLKLIISLFLFCTFLFMPFTVLKNKILNHKNILSQVEPNSFYNSLKKNTDYWMNEFMIIDYISKTSEIENNAIFVLGDISTLYILFKQAIPPNMSFYNCSPIREQQKIVNFLQKLNPEFVIYDRLNAEFDNVPNHVRCPLIFDFIFENYVFEKEFNNYILFKKSPILKYQSFGTWANIFSQELNLGFIPALSYNEYKFEKKDPQFVDAIFVQTGSCLTNEPAVLSFDNPLFSQKIKFRLRENQENYLIRLDRVWFWGYVKNVTITSRSSNIFQINQTLLPVNKMQLY